MAPAVWWQLGPYGGFSPVALAVKPPRLARIDQPGPQGNCLGAVAFFVGPTCLSSSLWVHLYPGFWCKSGDPGGQAVSAKAQPTDDGPTPNK